MERKGVSMFVIFAIIGIFILAMMLFSTTSYGKNAENFFSNTPNFDPGTQTKTPLEEIRYDIQNNVVQYYDGTAWLAFNKDGTAKLGDKLLDEKLVKSMFESYLTGYYFAGFNSGFNKRNEIYSSSSYYVTIAGMSETGTISLSLGSSKPLSGNYPVGTITLEIYKIYQNTADVPDLSQYGFSAIGIDGHYLSPYGFALVGNDGKLIGFYGINGNSDQLTAQWAQISSDALTRRNTLATPISIPYKINNAQKTPADSFCPKQYGTYIVISDLTKPVTTTTCST